MTVENAVAIVGAVVSIASATVAGIFGYLSIRNAMQSRYAQAEKEAGDAYDRMVAFRVAHPAVMRLSREWQPGYFEKVYLQVDSNEGQEWVTYYSYVELCIGYCNIVLSAWYQGLLSKTAFESDHKLLIKLLLTENNPIVEDLIQESKYISRHIKRFREDVAQDGWSWSDEHKLLLS